MTSTGAATGSVALAPQPDQTQFSTMSESWVSRAASKRLKQAVSAIAETAYTLADNLDREVSLNEMIAAALRETINQCQNGQGVIYSHDIFAIADELEAQ